MTKQLCVRDTSHSKSLSCVLKGFPIGDSLFMPDDHCESFHETLIIFLVSHDPCLPTNFHQWLWSCSHSQLMQGAD